MADAPVQLDLAQRLAVAGLAESLPGGSALARKRGGTGFSVDTLEELQAELGIVDPAELAGVEDGFAPLDSGLLVPLAYLPGMVGADSINPGAAGVVPEPAVGDQLRALTGGGIYSNELELAWLTKADGSRLHQFTALGDGDNGLYLAATGSTSRKARLGTRSSIDSDVDLVFETKGRGIVGHLGDPFETHLRRTLGYWAKGDAADFDAEGLSALTVESWDPSAGSPTPAAATVLRDTVSNYVQTATDDSVSSASGFSSPTAWIDPQHHPAIYFVGRSAFIAMRLWFGATQSDPVAGTDLATGGNAGVALWVDYTLHAPGRTLRLITCSGAPINLSKTGVVSVDGSGRLDRNDGGSWITDGVRVGDVVTLGGLGVAGNNGPQRVISITAGTGRRITFENVLTTEGVPAGAVTLTHPGQVELDTGFTPTANERFALRVRFMPDRWTWEFSRYNFTNRSWEGFVESDGVAAVPPGVLLKLFWRNLSLDGSSRTTAASAIFVRRGA